MRDYDYDKDKPKYTVTMACTRFLAVLTAQLPMLAAAIAVGIVVHSVFSEPFGFTCKSTKSERLYNKHSTAPKALFEYKKPTESPAETAPLYHLKPDDAAD